MDYFTKLPPLDTSKIYNELGNQKKVWIKNQFLYHRQNYSNNALFTSGKTSLHYAAENGHTDIVKHLIQNGIELEDVDDSGIVVLEILSDKYGSVGLGMY